MSGWFSIKIRLFSILKVLANFSDIHRTPYITEAWLIYLQFEEFSLLTESSLQSDYANSKSILTVEKNCKQTERLFEIFIN